MTLNSLNSFWKKRKYDIYFSILIIVFFVWLASEFLAPSPESPEVAQASITEQLYKEFGIEEKGEELIDDDGFCLIEELAIEDKKIEQWKHPEYDQNNIKQEAALVSGEFSKLDTKHQEVVMEAQVKTIMEISDPAYAEAANFEIQEKVKEIKEEIERDKYSLYVEKFISNKIDLPETLKVKDIILFEDTGKTLKIKTIFSRMFAATNSRVTEIACLKIDYGLMYDNFGFSPSVVDWKFLNDNNTGCQF